MLFIDMHLRFVAYDLLSYSGDLSFLISKMKYGCLERQSSIKRFRISFLTDHCNDQTT